MLVGQSAPTFCKFIMSVDHKLPMDIRQGYVYMCVYIYTYMEGGLKMMFVHFFFVLDFGLVMMFVCN